jgi:heterotetrameric sarcosine oxidase gamma subunit
VAELIRCSALAAVLKYGTFGANVQQPRVTFAERRPAALLRLSAAQDDQGFAGVVRNVIGLDLPRAPNTANASNSRALLWLAPRQWLLVCDGEQIAIGEQPLQGTLDKTGATVVDVSHAYLVVTISGERARDVLAKGVPIDIDPVAFEVGACAQTCLTDMNVLLHARELEAVDLYVARSYALSLWQWLTLSAAEFGYDVSAEGGGRAAEL